MKHIFIVVFLLVAYILLLRLPILKTKIQGNNFYYKDVLGFVYMRHSSCGWIGPCSYWDSPILGAHSFTFKPLIYNGLDCLDAYAKSTNTVYYLGNKQQIKDPATFELINNMYAKDSKSVYKLCNLEVLNDTDPNQFQLIGPVCSKSPTSVYCFEKEVVNADASSFEHVWRGYYKDKSHVYYLGEPLNEVDPNTFELLSWGYFKDKNNIYFFDESIKDLVKVQRVDTSTFMVLTEMYAKDSVNVFKKGIVLPSTNPKTFEVPIK